jgi:hypothetical protein
MIYMVTTLENHGGAAPRNQGDNNFPRIDWFRKSGRSQLPRMDISFYLLTIMTWTSAFFRRTVCHTKVR